MPSSLHSYKRFLLTLGKGDSIAGLSYEDVKNTALVELSVKVQIPIEKLQEMSIYEKLKVFKMINVFTRRFFTVVRHAHIFKKGAGTEENLRSFLLETGMLDAADLTAEDVRNAMIDTLTKSVNRKVEFIAFLDNKGLEKLAQWVFTPPLKRYVSVLFLSSLQLSFRKKNKYIYTCSL